MQLIVSQAVACILAWKAARWRPGFQFSKSHFVNMAKFGNKVVMVDLVATVRAAAEAAIISTVLGPAALGYLSIARRLVQVTQDLGATALVPVSTVVFAKVRDTAERLQSAYVRASRISYSAVSPIMTVVVVGGPLVVPLLFGDGWDQSVPVAQGLWRWQQFLRWVPCSIMVSTTGSVDQVGGWRIQSSLMPSRSR